MSGRRVGWDDEAVGSEAPAKAKGGKAKKEDVDLDLDALGLELETDNSDDVPEEQPKPKRKAKKKAKKQPKKEQLDPDPEFDVPWGDEGVGKAAREAGAEVAEDHVHRVADKVGIDLSMECPVCRSLEPCECEEEDRSFVRRTRFEEDVKKVARCPRCGAPLSVAYLARPGATPSGIIKGDVAEGTPPRAGFNLSQFEALWACSCCHTEALATAVLSVKRR